jgi:hypothetical protein
MHVSDMEVDVSASVETFCLGESAQITSSVTGGSGTFTYSWTSDPVGFTSDEDSVTVNPDVTTTYFLEVFDGSATVEDQITLTVNPLPSVYIGSDTTICQGENIVISAGEGFASYMWNTGETTNSITATAEGGYWVEVTNEFGCAGSDTLQLLVAQFPDKPVISSGPASVDNYNSTSSTYTCAEAANALSYQWAVTPAEAGTISSSGTEGEFAWTTGYTGSVLITVMGINDCGNGEVSEAFATEIYSSAGLNENSADRQLIIYPNPTDGKVSVRLSSQNDFTGDLAVSDAAGSKVYSLAGVTISSGGMITLDLGQLSEGIYSVKLSSRSVVYSGKVIIK